METLEEILIRFGNNIASDQGHHMDGMARNRGVNSVVHLAFETGGRAGG